MLNFHDGSTNVNAPKRKENNNKRKDKTHVILTVEFFRILLYIQLIGLRLQIKNYMKYLTNFLILQQLTN